MFLTILVSALLAVAPRPTPRPELDVLIVGGRVVDGSGAPWVRADVGIRDGRIVALGVLSGATATRRIDATGRVVAPGFIDMLGQSELNALVDGRVESKIRQGITTEVTGEGESAAPLDAAMLAESRPWLERYALKIDWTDLEGYFGRFRRTPPTINLATYVGAANARELVVGREDVRPTPAQLARMEGHIEQAMRQGAIGLSSALIYAPASFAQTPELIALARVAGRAGGSYATHIRGEEQGVLTALDEAITVGREAGLPVDVYHLKVAGRANWGRMPEVLSKLERARAEGVDVAACVYPYTAAWNGLDASLPAWALAGGVDALLHRLHDPDSRARILGEVRTLLETRESPEAILLLSAPQEELRLLMGLHLDEAARRLGRSPAEALLDLVERSRASAMVVRDWMHEDDVRLAVRHPWVAFCTDAPGQAVDGPFAGVLAHPRAFGAMAKVLGTYVRQEHLLTLEEAVRKMTSLPASRARLWDRGLLRPGLAADVVVFDPERIADLATYKEPLRYAQGVTHVIVNGRVVLDDGKMTGERPGQGLRSGH